MTINALTGNPDPSQQDAQAVPQGWREFLKEIEWANSDYNAAGDAEPYCVCCDAWQSQGHKPDCKFIAMLNAVPTPTAQASEMSKVSWGVDWGLSGDRACASIVRRLPDGVIEVLATEIGPQINWLQRVAPIDWSQAGALMEAAASAKSAGFTTGTTNWAAHICRHMEAISARQKPSWTRLPADDTEGGAA